jgi:hypothetical protein
MHFIDKVFLVGHKITASVNKYPCLLGKAYLHGENPSVFVIPANAGIQDNQVVMDPRFCGGEGLEDFLQDNQKIIWKRTCKISAASPSMGGGVSRFLWF